jgi:uncharacterized membrane protein
MFLETLVTAIIMLAVDLGWLTYRMDYHNNLIKNIQGTLPVIRPVPAALIYILIPIAVMVFAVIPSTTITEAILKGAFLGLSMYGVYDLTNYAMFTKYTFDMTVTDMAWGTFICAFGAAVGFTLRNSVFRRQYSMFNLSWLKHFKYQYPMKQIEV